MMMRIDKAGQQHLLAIADHRRDGIVPMQRREAADRGDYAVLLQHGAVVDLLPTMTVERTRDHMLAANDRDGNGAPP